MAFLGYSRFLVPALGFGVGIAAGASLVACGGDSFQAAGSGGGQGGSSNATGGATSGGAGATPIGGGLEAEGGADSSAGAGPGPVASAYRTAILADGPLVYWRMGTVTSRIVADETGGGNDLVLQGTGHELGVDGAIQNDADGAIGFDGAASFAIASDARALDFTGNAAFTLECWAKWSSGGMSYFQHLFSNVQGSAGARDGYALYLLPQPAADSPRSAFEYDLPAADLGVFGPMPAEGTWAHYAAVYDGARATLYVNGTLANASAVAASVLARTGPFAVARASDGGASFFKGALDELAVYPRALGAAVIARHFGFAK